MFKIFQKLRKINNDIEDNEYEEDYVENENDEIITQEQEYEENEIDDNKNSDEKWLEKEYEEGQLSVDVYQTHKNIIVKSTIAGVKSSDIDISINNDMLTIRGKRQMNEKIEDKDYLFKECYWGSFSRSIILPVEIVPEKIDANLENGVLTIILPKAKVAKEISIKVKEK